MTPTLLLFDDVTAGSFHPFSLTRPVGELIHGALLLRERAERHWATPCRGHLSGEALSGFNEVGAPPVVSLEDVGVEGTRIFQCGRFAPWGKRPPLPKEPTTLLVEGSVVGWILPPGAPGPDPDLLLHPEPLPGSASLVLEGTLLASPWELLARNGDQLRQDIPAFFPGYAAPEVPGCHLLGDGLLSLGRDVRVEPGSVFDLRKGPIRLSDGAEVKAHTRLAGPVFIGPETMILGGSISAISAGPSCKIRGEVSNSLILGFSNKAHDGFLGHAYLGRWVNLGAFTTNSNLKNDYGPVRVGSPEGPVETGLLKLGCFLGDHVKTGIGTLLNTGTVVGAGCNIFGGTMPPIHVPPFSWGQGADLTEYRLEKFLEVTARVLDRRGVALDEGTEALLRRAWEESRQERMP